MFSVLFCFFKQKTAYEMRISDWSSDVCSSDLCSARSQHGPGRCRQRRAAARGAAPPDRSCRLFLLHLGPLEDRDEEAVGAVARRRQGEKEIGRASCRERVCKYV